MPHSLTILASLALTLCATSAAATSCAEDDCTVGQKVTVHTSPTEPVAVCPTDALTSYSNFTLYMAAAYGATTHAETINPDTVEANATAEMADMAKKLRDASGVATPSAALKACSQSQPGAKVTIVEVGKKTNNTKVAGVNGEAAYWIPTQFLERADDTP